LKPDQRFLKAVVEIQAFFTGTPASRIEIAFADQHWQVTYQGQSVGQLPEYPDFQHFLELLVTWAQRLGKRENLPFSVTPLSVETRKYLDTQLQLFFAPNAANVANSLNKLWANGKRTTELLPYATQALTLLVLQQLDELETAEQLPIKAITLLVLTKAFSNHSVTQEEALLAYLLGYSAYARQVALTLDNDNAVRHYIHHDGERLKSMAENPGASQQTRYLYLLWLARQQDYEGWRDWINPYFKATENVLPLLKTGVMLNQFGTNKRIATVLPYAAVLSLAYQISENNQATKMAKLLSQHFFSKDSSKLANAIATLFFQANKVSTVIAFFEIEIQLLNKQYAGPFLDGDTYTAYFRGHFYSGLYRSGAMQVGVDILEAKGELDQAEKVARAVYHRYPDNLTSRLKLTTFYWRQGQYQKAADVLSQRRTLNNAEDWRFQMGKDFVDTFAKQTDKVALQAYHLLLKNGIKHQYLQELATAVAKAKRLTLADKMLEPLQYQCFGQMMLYVKRYAYRASCKTLEVFQKWQVKKGEKKLDYHFWLKKPDNYQI
jgi:hypothetical protein